MKYLAPNMKNFNTMARFVVFVVFTLFACIATPADRSTAADRDRIVVMVSVDGLANFYLDDPAAPLPTIRQLAREGAVAAGMKASDPTATWPNHTTLVTGVTPARHGVVGNNHFDRLKGERITLIWDPNYDKDQIVRVPTIYDMAKAAGLKTAAVHWPATRNARSLDWTSPDVMKVELVARYTTPALLEECRAAGLDLLKGDDGQPRPRNESTAEDDFWTRVFTFILEKHRPDLALFHVLAVDYTQHKEGPRTPAAYEAIQAADGQVRQIWDVLQRVFPGKATLIIVSDHGFSLNKANISAASVLKDAGLVEMRGTRIAGGDVQLVLQGGSAFVYVIDELNRDSIRSRVKAAFEDIEGVAKVALPHEFSEYGMGDPQRDPHAPDMILFAEIGYYFGEAPTAGGTPLKGSHGHDSHYRDMQAVFIACGAGIKPGTKLGQIENTAVAPTIARLLGVELPGAEGKPLEDAMTK